MENKTLNIVHLDGILAGLSVKRLSDEHAVGSACVVTLLPTGEKSAGGEERFEKLRHDVIVEADDSEGVSHLLSMDESFRRSRESDSVFACSVSGSLASDESLNTYVSCGASGFQRTEKVKTNDNNIVNIEGEVTSVMVARSHVVIRFDVGDYHFESFLREKANRAAWETVMKGNIRKGDTVYFNGPLLSQRLSDGNHTMKMCAISPKVMKNRTLAKKVRRKGSQSVG